MRGRGHLFSELQPYGLEVTFVKQTETKKSTHFGECWLLTLTCKMRVQHDWTVAWTFQRGFGDEVNSTASQFGWQVEQKRVVGELEIHHYCRYLIWIYLDKTIGLVMNPTIKLSINGIFPHKSPTCDIHAIQTMGVSKTITFDSANFLFKFWSYSTHHFGLETKTSGHRAGHYKKKWCKGWESLAHSYTHSKYLLHNL